MNLKLAEEMKKMEEIRSKITELKESL